MAELPDDLVTSSNLDVIYTVLTSPDSDKAKYWGHMPETVTNSAGVKFKRPQLATETPSTSSYTYNSEIWSLVTISNTQKRGRPAVTQNISRCLPICKRCTLTTLKAQSAQSMAGRCQLASSGWLWIACQNWGIPVYAAGYRREKFNHFCRDDRRTDMPCGSACPIARDHCVDVEPC